MAFFQNRFLKESVNSEYYFSYSAFLRGLFREKVGKIVLDAGFTCPNRDGKKGYGGCIFCDAYGSGIGKKLSLEEQIEKQLKYKSKKYKKFLLYFQAFTNTYAPSKILKQKYDIIYKYKQFVGLIIGTRADCINRRKLELINEYTKNYFVQVEYGLQSLNAKTRKWMNRLETLEEFERAIKETKKFKNIFIGVHVIFGLPFEEKDYHVKLAHYINKLGIDGIKIHNLYIPKTSRLAKIYKKEKINLISQEEFVDRVYDFINLLNKNIVIMRIGGTAPLEELVAPAWAVNKYKTYDLLKQKFKQNNSD